MSYAVVILSARARNLIPCVRALRACEPELPSERIIVVDDGARAGAESHLEPLTWVDGVKPFVFARNANVGIRAAASDVILLNDDAALTTPGGFSRWAALMASRPEVGVCSAGVRGLVGNRRQQVAAHGRLELETESLAFVCVYIPRSVFAAVGPLDERFVGYGYEDNDYCDRIRAAGLGLAVFHGCAVDHDGRVPSTFRTRPDIDSLMTQNRQLYLQTRSPKPDARVIGYPAPPSAESEVSKSKVDLLYLAWNRLEFTRETFEALIANTDWSRVNELCVYDDGSTDGTREWLEQNIARVPAPHRLVATRFGSAVTAMVHYIERSTAAIVAKLDNDAVVPPGWLSESLGVLDRNPGLSLLGIEAMFPVEPRPLATRGYVPAQFISGLGLYRREAFARDRPAAVNIYFGLEEWQMAQGKRLTRGWINPALPLFLLDRMPLQPWRGLSDAYIRRGWQRPWQNYPLDCTLWHWRWPGRCTPAPAGGLQLNIHCGDTPVDGFTNVSLSPADQRHFIDLTGTWPWGDSAVQAVLAQNVVERLRDKIGTMNELWRILRDGGTAELVLATTDGTGAFQDPAHVSYWNRRSFFYYEEGNPYRERHAHRYGIKARFQILAEHAEKTPDGVRLAITLRAVKGAPAAIPASKPAPVVLARTAGRRSVAGPEFVGAMRVKNESRYIRSAIESVLGLCERAVIFDDHSSDDTLAIAESFGDRCLLLRSRFEGLDEARDKNYVLESLVALNPVWVLWIDGDEVLEPSGPAALRRAANAPGVAAYSLRIAYLWDDPGQVRVDGVYGRLARPSFFRLRGQNSSRLQFKATGNGGNFHCGNVPHGLEGRVRALPSRLKHYGYLTLEERQRKYRLYTSVDPNNRGEDNYRHIIGIPGARHAPGPPAFLPWSD